MSSTSEAATARPEGPPRPLIVLVDMDGVVADFEAGFLAAWRSRHPLEPYVSVERRHSFYVRDNYPARLRPAIAELQSEPGFFRALPPVAGAVKGVHGLLDAGVDVRICTAPLSASPTCASEKLAWVGEHLGRALVGRTIVAKDKTYVVGDVLLDDRPEVTGDLVPLWEHVVFDASYNRKVTGRRRVSWDNWVTLLERPLAA